MTLRSKTIPPAVLPLHASQDLPLGAGGGSEAAVAVPMMHESGKHALISGDHLPAIQEGHCPGDGDAAGAAGW